MYLWVSVVSLRSVALLAVCSVILLCFVLAVGAVVNHVTFDLVFFPRFFADGVAFFLSRES